MPGPETQTDPHYWLAELATRTAPELRAYLSRFSQNLADIEDWMQEALLRVCAASMDRDLLEPRAYLFRTARNVALGRLEHRRVRYAARFDLELISRQRHEPRPVHRLAQTEQDVATLLQVIEGLPERCREAFVLCKVHGFSHREIAEIMQVSVSTVEKHLVKALRLCRAILVGEPSTSGSPLQPGAAGDATAADRRGTRVEKA